MTQTQERNMQVLSVQNLTGGRWLRCNQFFGTHYVKQTGKNRLVVLEHNEKGAEKLETKQTTAYNENTGVRVSYAVCCGAFDRWLDRGKYAILTDGHKIIIRPSRKEDPVRSKRKENSFYQVGAVNDDFLIKLPPEELRNLQAGGRLKCTLYTKGNLYAEFGFGETGLTGHQLKGKKADELDGVSFNPLYNRGWTRLPGEFLKACGISRGDRFNVSYNRDTLIMSATKTDCISGEKFDTYESVFDTVNVSKADRKSVLAARQLIDFTDEDTILASAKEALQKLSEKLEKLAGQNV